jgi:hypothetical protein
MSDPNCVYDEQVHVSSFGDAMCDTATCIQPTMSVRRSTDVPMEYNACHSTSPGVMVTDVNHPEDASTPTGETEGGSVEGKGGSVKRGSVDCADCGLCVFRQNLKHSG